MKNTFDLYRCDSSEWSDLRWKDALKVRIEKATEAKDYYRVTAKKLNPKFGNEYNKLLNLYRASDKARLFNISILEES